jgi:hypothetical protein
MSLTGTSESKSADEASDGDRDSSSDSDVGPTNSNPDRDSSARRRRPAPPSPPRSARAPSPEADSDTTEADDPERGFLVYLFTGEQDPSEIVVFRKICMKYGLQAWDEMERHLPWRTRAAFRTTLCRIIQKQALSEYSGIKADPFAIQKDNPLDFSLADDGYAVKGGMLINQKWDRSAHEWGEMRNGNIKKYGLTDEEAEAIEVPAIISVEFMRQQCEKRRQSLLLLRAAIRNEQVRRAGITDAELGIEDLVLLPAETLVRPPNGSKLETVVGENQDLFEKTESDLEDG